MRFLLVLILTLTALFTGCTKDVAKEVLCDAGKTASSLISAQIVVQLDCKNADAVRADIDQKLIDLKVCAAPAPAAGVVSIKSAVGDAICPPVVGALFTGLLSQVPTTWGCGGGQLTADLKTKLLAACSKAL